MESALNYIVYRICQRWLNPYHATPLLGCCVSFPCLLLLSQKPRQSHFLNNRRISYADHLYTCTYLSLLWVNELFLSLYILFCTLIVLLYVNKFHTHTSFVYFLPSPPFPPSTSLSPSPPPPSLPPFHLSLTGKWRHRLGNTEAARLCNNNGFLFLWPSCCDGGAPIQRHRLEDFESEWRPIFNIMILVCTWQGINLICAVCMVW